LLLGADGAAGRETLIALLEGGAPVMAVSARVPDFSRPDLTWLQYDLSREHARVQASVMVCADALSCALRQARAMPSLRRIVALSSADVLLGRHGLDADERRSVDALSRHEEQLRDLCVRRDITLTLLRPTLIYGSTARTSLAALRASIERHRWFPVAGAGLRQPVHAEDLAALVVRLAGSPVDGTFELGGGERLSYPDFVRRVASAQGRELRLVRSPAWLLSALLRFMHWIGRSPEFEPARLEHQRADRIVDDSEARRQLGWNPRPFNP